MPAPGRSPDAVRRALLLGGAAGLLATPARAETPGRLLVRLAGIYRRLNGLPGLRWNTQLAAAAAEQARDNARRGVMSHESADGADLVARVRRAGYAFAWCAENIAVGQRSAMAATKSWISSPLHNDNLLAPEGVEAGGAVAEGREGLHWTLVLARPRPR